MCQLKTRIPGLCFKRAAYCAQEGVTVVLRWYFDSHYNDGYSVRGKTIITVLGWLASVVMIICLSLLPVGGVEQWESIYCHRHKDWRMSHQSLLC